MAEVTWTEEGQSAPPKKKIPTWVWFCGGGCLAMLVLAIVAGGLVFTYVKKGQDPELQWPQLAKILPFDERPANLEMQFGNQLGLENYNLVDHSHGYQIQIQHHKGASGVKQREKLFSSDPPEFPQDMIVMKFADLKPGLVEVQGRDIRVIRMRIEVADIVKKRLSKEDQAAVGTMIMADLTPEGEDGLLFLQVTREHSNEPISDEDFREFLKPFHVGPKR